MLEIQNKITSYGQELKHKKEVISEWINFEIFLFLTRNQFHLFNHNPGFIYQGNFN